MIINALITEVRVNGRLSKESWLAFLEEVALKPDAGYSRDYFIGRVSAIGFVDCETWKKLVNASAITSSVMVYLGACSGKCNITASRLIEFLAEAGTANAAPQEGESGFELVGGVDSTGKLWYAKVNETETLGWTDGFVHVTEQPDGWVANNGNKAMAATNQLLEQILATNRATNSILFDAGRSPSDAEYRPLGVSANVVNFPAATVQPQYVCTTVTHNAVDGSGNAVDVETTQFYLIQNGTPSLISSLTKYRTEVGVSDTAPAGLVYVDEGNIVQPVPVPATTIANLTNTSFELQWPKLAGTYTYEARFYPRNTDGSNNGSGAAVAVTTGATNKAIFNGLAQNTEYNWSLKIGRAQNFITVTGNIKTLNVQPLPGFVVSGNLSGTDGNGNALVNWSISPALPSGVTAAFATDAGSGGPVNGSSFQAWHPQDANGRAAVVYVDFTATGYTSSSKRITGGLALPVYNPAPPQSANWSIDKLIVRSLGADTMIEVHMAQDAQYREPRLLDKNGSPIQPKQPVGYANSAFYTLFYNAWEVSAANGNDPYGDHSFALTIGGQAVQSAGVVTKKPDSVI